MKENKIDKAVRIFKKGGVIIFPTDTVWGIGASIDNLAALKKLYQIKKRPIGKPTAVLIGSFIQAYKLGVFDNKAKKLAQKYWPGGLTIVVKAKKNIPLIIQGKKRTIGLRMPNNKTLLKILKKAKTGIVASSANFSGQPAPAKLKDVNPCLLQLVDLVVKGKNSGQQASTVIDLSSRPYQILRKGLISLS